jgi:hypothetical protein
MKHSKINIFLITLLISLFLCPLFALAQSSSSGNIAPGLEVSYPSLEPFATNPPTTPMGPNVLSNYIVYVFGFVIVVSAIAAVVMVAIGGVEYVSSAGSPEKMKSGANKITSSVLGLIILGCSFMILKTINPNLIEITDPNIAPVANDFGYGVWACKSGIDFDTLWNMRKAIKLALAGTTEANSGLKTIIKSFNALTKIMESYCYNVKTAGSVQKGFESQIKYIYLVPEEMKRAFGTIMYAESIQKSKARALFFAPKGEPILYLPTEYYIPDKKVAYLRPFYLVYPAPTDWYTTLYQLPHKNRGATEAKWITCSTGGKVAAWCDLSALAVVSTSASGSSQNPNCTPDWSCGSWGACANSQQSRTCTDRNSCGTPTKTETQSCTSGFNNINGYKIILADATCGICKCLDTKTYDCVPCVDSVGCPPINNPPANNPPANNPPASNPGTNTGGDSTSSAGSTTPKTGCGTPSVPTACATSSGSTSSSTTKPPKITSVEFKGSQFIVFFKDSIEKWTWDTTLDIVGPGDENNMSSGSYIMGEWNEECKEKRAEEPNSESYYPCAKKAVLINAVFL